MPDDVEDALRDGPEKIGRTYIYGVEKIGNRPNAPNPTLSVLTTLADLYGVELGDCFPHSAVTVGEVEQITAALAALNPESRKGAISTMAAFIRTLAGGLSLAAASSTDNVVPFPAAEDRKPLSPDAMERLEEVMKQAGAEPRKAARGPEREVRFYGLASAGEGIEFFDDIPSEYRQIPQWAWKKGARGVFKAAGDSMHDVGIWDQDIMFVKPTPFPKSGEIVICTLNKKVFVKRLKLNERGQPVQLESKNEAYKPIPITPDDEVEFFGVVVGRTGDM